MLYDRKAVQENIRNKDGKRVFYLGKGHQLTSDARDWLSQERIPVLPGESARPEAFHLLTGGVLAQKPEHMTHLNAEYLVSKTHPRIAFRGGMDALEAALLLAAAETAPASVASYFTALEPATPISATVVMRESLRLACVPVLLSSSAPLSRFQIGVW